MGSRPFFTSFVCDRLANHVEARDLVKLNEDDGRFFLYFNDIDKMSLIYCDFKQQIGGKELKRDAKSRKDNLKNTLALSEKNGSLKKVASGTDHEHHTDYLKYEVMNSELWHSLTSNFRAVQNTCCMIHWNFPTSYAETSSDTGLDMTQSEHFHDQTHGNFRESRSAVLSSESSDTSGAFQIDDQLVDASKMEKMARDLPDTFDDSLFHQMNLSTSKNETSQRPPPLSTAVDEKIPELTIVPKHDNIEGGGEFIVRANQNLPEGIYNIQFDAYGNCEARGSGSTHLDGRNNIPSASRRRGTHWITVHVFDENGKSIGDIPFEYRDEKANLTRKELVKNSNQGGSNLDNEPHQRKKKSSSKPMDCTGFNKKFKNDAVDMPMLMYLCDEMAKGGDEHFFSTLIKLGILADVFAYRSEYYKDVDVTAREHGHNKLAEMIAMSSRELPCVHDMETLTIGKLIDAVQQERSLANSDPIYSSDSDGDSNSCSSGYNGDCDSQGDQFEDNTDAIFGSCESQNNSENTGKIYVQWKERCEESMVKLEELTGIPDTGKSSFTEKDESRLLVITARPAFGKSVDSVIALARARSLWQGCEDFKKDESRISVIGRPENGKSVIALARARSIWQECEYFRKKRELAVRHLDFSDSNLIDPNVQMLQALAIQTRENVSGFKAKLVNQFSSECVNPWLDVQLLIVHGNLLLEIVDCSWQSDKRPLAKEILRVQSRAMDDYEKGIDVEPLCSDAVETPISCSRRSAGRNPVESIANKGLYGCTLKAVMDFNLRSQVVFIRCAHKFIPSKNVQDEKDEALTTTSSKGGPKVSSEENSIGIEIGSCSRASETELDNGSASISHGLFSTAIAKHTIQPVSHSVEGIRVDREANLAEHNQTNRNENDGECCTNGSLKGNGDKPDAVLGSCNSQYNGNLNEEKNSVNVAEPVTRASLKREPEPVTIDVEKKEHIFEDEDNGEKTSLVERSLNPNQKETVAGVDNKTTDSGLCSHLTKLDGQFSMIPRIKENEDKTGGVLGKCNSHYNGDTVHLSPSTGNVFVEAVIEHHDEFDDFFFDQINLPTSENETSQRPPPLSTAVDEEVLELTIVPDFCYRQGGGQFIVLASHDLGEGTYHVQFDDYGICKAWGSGSKHLDGCDNIPAARRCGTHVVTVQVFDVRGKSIGGISFEYRDNINGYCSELAKNSRSLSGSKAHNEPHQLKKTFSSNSMVYTGSNKTYKSGPVDMPMVMYFYDEMAKGGDEDFFSALKKLGILAEVLVNRSEYYKDFAVTAKEHDHNELAEMITVSPRELPCDRDMERLTIGKLLDAVQQERSLANSVSEAYFNANYTKNPVNLIHRCHNPQPRYLLTHERGKVIAPFSAYLAYQQCLPGSVALKKRTSEVPEANSEILGYIASGKVILAASLLSLVSFTILIIRLTLCRRKKGFLHALVGCKNDDADHFSTLQRRK